MRDPEMTDRMPETPKSEPINPAGNLPGLLSRLHVDQQEIVAALARSFAAGGAELFLVGGIVRDMLLDRPLPNDLDCATSAMPEETQAFGLAAGAGSVYLVGEKFGTVGLVFSGESAMNVEITTYRQETYPNGTRHPEVSHGVTLDEDLSRRDFTVNAIAVNAMTGELHDPFDGQSDLVLSTVRAVGDPDERFQEDPLRLMRAARFVAQLGFLVEGHTFAAMVRNAPALERISKERIYAEATKLLCGDYASHGLDVLRQAGLLQVAMPELAPLAEEADRFGANREKDLWVHTGRVIDQAPAQPVVRWAALLHDAAKPHTRTVDRDGEVHFFGHEKVGANLADSLLRRLKADKATLSAVRRLVEMHARPESYEQDWTDSAVRRLMLEADGVLEDLLDLAAADVTSARVTKQRAAAERIRLLRARIERLNNEFALEQLVSPLDGTQLMEMFDRPPGRWIAIVKDRLREMVIDGTLAVDDRERAGVIARQLVADTDSARPDLGAGKA